MPYKCGDLRIASTKEYLICIDGYPEDGYYFIGTKEDLLKLKADIEAMVKGNE